MKRILLSVAILSAIGASAQLNESFNDGDFTANPVWAGTANWQIATNSDVAAGATSSNTLRLNENGAGTNYLSTQILGSWNNSQSWTFWIGRRSQAATDANRIYVWLYANEANVISATVDGYRIRYGDDAPGNDNIFLERVTDGVAITIFTSPNTAAGTTFNGIEDFGFLVRVTRDASGLWSIYTSTLPQSTGTGAIATDAPIPANTSVLQGQVTDNTYSGFISGYVALHTLNTSGVPTRDAVEFDQFRVLFFSETVLPVKFSSLDARATNSSVSLKWNVATEENLSGYNVERSADGSSFSKIGFVKAEGNNSYSFVDSKPSSISYYRIKSVDIDGRYAYSTVALVKGGKSMIVLKAFPIPFIKNVSIQHPTAVAGSLITISSQDGRTIKSIVPAVGMQQTDVDLSLAKAGLYLVRFNNGNGEVETLKILKQ